MEPIGNVIKNLCTLKFPDYRDPMYEIYIRTGALEMPPTLSNLQAWPARLTPKEKKKKKARWEEIRKYEIWLKSQTPEQIRELYKQVLGEAMARAEQQERERRLAAAALIDWDFWRSMPGIKLWEACALSMALDPDKMKIEPNNPTTDLEDHGPFFRSISFPNRAVEEDFQKRLRLAKAVHGESDEGRIALAKFAAWAVTIPLRGIPEEFSKLATSQLVVDAPTKSQELVTAIQTNKHEPKQARQERLILEWLRENGYDPENLPMWKYNKPGPKSAAQKALLLKYPSLFHSEGVFGKAWGRLSIAKSIRHKK